MASNASLRCFLIINCYRSSISVLILASRTIGTKIANSAINLKVRRKIGQLNIALTLFTHEISARLVDVIAYQFSWLNDPNGQSTIVAKQFCINKTKKTWCLKHAYGMETANEKNHFVLINLLKNNFEIIQHEVSYCITATNF